MPEWFTESLHPCLGQRLQIERVICKLATRHQDLLVFENKFLGKVLVLDGIIQTTEADEFVYHEMLSHVPIMSHDHPAKVLIVGGGDGGILREVIKHRVVEEVVMVELDPEVVEVCKKHMPRVSSGAFDDPRLQLIIGDAYQHVASTDQKYDVIIIDSPDPVGPAAKLFSSEFYENCQRILFQNGILVLQNGVPFLQRNELLSSANLLAQHFEDVTFYSAPVPTYQGGEMAFGWASNSQQLRIKTHDELVKRYRESAVATSYYNPAIHLASFVLPKWICELLASSNMNDALS